MITLRPPSAGQAERLFAELAGAPFSYAEVGATRGFVPPGPPGYDVDRYATVLGSGPRAFERARAALAAWRPFRQPWIRLFAPSEPGPDALVAVVARVAGLWWTNVNRVLYTIDQAHAYGFAYGTLSVHAEQGEELFVVESSPESGDVSFRILAVSRPRHLLACLGYPLSRTVQRRFCAGACEAMRDALDGVG